MSDTRWHRGVAPLRVEVPCSGSTHTVLWRRGALVLPDHDAVADSVLVALGGEPPACLEVRRSWRAGYVEEEPPAVSAGLVRSLSSLAEWLRGAGPRPAVLPEPLRRLREASLLHTWGRGLRGGDAGGTAQATFLRRAVVRKVREVAVEQLRAACGGRWSEADVTVTVVDDRGPTARGTATTTAACVEIAVPASWLTSVWVRGRERWRGGLVLEAPTPTGGPLLVARWSADGSGGWELVSRWEEG